MTKILEFYNPQGNPVRTSNYIVKTIQTSKGKRNKLLQHTEERNYINLQLMISKDKKW